MSHAATAPFLGAARDPMRSAAIRFFNLYDDDDDTPSSDLSGDSDSGKKPEPKPPKQPKPKKEKDPNKPNPLATFFKNKRNLYITIGAAAAVLIAIIVTVVLLMQPKTFYLDDYFTVTAEGTDGYGSATVEWDREALTEVNEYFGKKSSKKVSDQLGQYGGLLGDFGDALGDALGGLYGSTFSLPNYVSIVLEPSSDLKNGDVVAISAKFPEDFEKTYGVRLKLRNETFTVSGLKSVSAYNPIEGITVDYTGYNGYGGYAFNLPEGSVATSFGTANYYVNYYGELQVTLEGETGRSYTLTYAVSVPDELENGDLITVTLVEDSSPSAETLAAAFGITVPDQSTTYTVSGLGDLVTGNPSDYMTMTYDGYSGYGTATLSASQTSAKLGDHTLQISTEDGWGSWHYLYIEIQSGNSDDSYRFTYEAKFSDGLSNDDVLTFSTGESDVERIRARFGLIFPTEFTCTVSGLDVGTAADPFTSISMTYTGYNGFGTAEAALPAETVTPAGSYVLKPTLNGNELVVVVADAAGENIFTVTYRLNKTSGLANGDEISFVYRSSFGAKNLREILETYSLNFPEEKTFIVSSLAAVTEVDVRDQLSFDFEGENGSITMTVSLKQTSITVGGYTINLDVKLESGWFSTYWVETFTIVDAEGNAIASGRYETSNMNNLSEGGTVTIREDMNESQIATLTGLLFSTESKQVIVSTR